MITVSLEAARALKAAGFPQSEYPQLIWLGGVLCGLRYQDFEPEPERPPLAVYAAPDALTALAWLENANGIQWCKSIKQVGGEWRYVGWPSTEDFSCPTADALIIAICQR